MLYSNILETIGNTPLVSLAKIKDAYHLKTNIFAKLEMFNPGGSIKDRIAFNMIKEAYQAGLINQDTIIIEPTSGNTGIGLALVAAYYGNELVLVMPDTMSLERRQLLEAYGAKLVLTEGKLKMQGAIKKAQDLAKLHKNSFIPSQFDNKFNPEIHYYTTGPEIYQALSDKVDVLISTIGTGGTISGVGKYLKEKSNNIKVIGVEPSGSPFLTKGISGPHQIQGIGAGFKPNVLDLSIIDEIITISDEKAISGTRDLIYKEGIFAGISSGAALAAALKVSKRQELNDKNIVIILPDSGNRYLSTNIYNRGENV